MSRVVRRRGSLRTKSVALGMLFVASVIGNVAVSHVRPDVASRGEIEADVPGIASNFVSPAAYGRLSQAASDVSEATAEQPADGAIVPALYSWDPEVKFVFYRQVTKWM